METLLSQILSGHRMCCRRGNAGWYQPFRSGAKKYEDIREAKWEAIPEWEKLTGGYHALKDEVKMWAEEVRDRYGLESLYDHYDDGEVVKLWDFNQRHNGVITSYHNRDNRGVETNDMKKWIIACDSDYNEGYTRCDWTVSPSGRALFSGYLDTKLPLDGSIARAGYAFVGCEKKRRSFYRQDYFDWNSFTHLLVRCRGDGRNWFIILNVSDEDSDVSWFDRYQYVLYTHGGPYWQWCKIPFSRFYLQHKGYAQEVQSELPKGNVSQIGFLLADQYSGPFNLEIDYVGAIRDDKWTEETAYEKYYHKENPFKSPGTT
ncbi:unnamed protein product [Medioppia subpectinata]|uniref:NADH:ubiquinone oxidoreductase intermediate-associated protein 30 domain-containing protein n=1 Tax=Medioppia subpectinata TaxID=1979941 RepID=A0A7R9KZS8_9ACAR|nr:unnamed protein product [Medioppia subpectinata]CAG2112915.1 unnamed protein product [Medioppia subpectinata]